MGIADDRLPMPPAFTERNISLAGQWRTFSRAATIMACLTAPAFFLLLYRIEGWSLWVSALVTFLAVIAFRGLVDVVARKMIPWPSLFGAGAALQAEDIANRRRSWYWAHKYKVLLWLGGSYLLLTSVIYLFSDWFGDGMSFVEALKAPWQGLADNWAMIAILGVQLPILFLVNLLIFLGPLLYFSIKQIQSFEPGDADWGVRMEDVRGQEEAKEEVSRVVALWQSGEEFERLGGKRERGMLFLGAPGTGKTMLSKAIATNFNCPFVTLPGSGFQQMWMGMDALVVRYLAYKAKKAAKKWGGQAIVFIDEIDAVGMRRQALGGGFPGRSQPQQQPTSRHDLCFFGPNGALTPDGDLVLETREWRERLFAARKEPATPRYPNPAARIGQAIARFFPGGMGGMGQQSLQQLLVVMDGIDNPPWMRKTVTNRFNTFLDATYVIPSRIGKVPLRLPRPKPATEQIYFIGACNVPLEVLDPALTRPGRMGRHIWFRTPTKDDRKDVFDRYLGKVAHEEDLDSPRRREELARITNGYSPAMIEQVCSMALTYSHHDARERFGWGDIVEAMTTVESGSAVRVEYIAEETRAVAIHEAGHAAAGHVYMKDVLSTRLSIRKRGASLGHHQAIELRERFSSWRHEEVAKLIWTLGAMAAERVFYGENSAGVGGDVQSATMLTAWMVGSCAMGPERVNLDGRFATEDEEDEARKKLMRRFEEFGLQIMQRSGGGGLMQADPIAGVLGDPSKRGAAAQLLGQAYLTAHWLIEANRGPVERIADTLIERREMHGDEVVELLDQVGLRRPEVDILDYSRWPKL